MPNRHARLEGAYRAESEHLPLAATLQSRLANAVRDERSRIARDLHAGVLQRLAAIRIHLSTVLEAGAPDARLAEIADWVDTVALELQTTISCAEPAELARAGIGAALRAQVPTSAMPVEVRDQLTRRHPTRVEIGVYFACSEAIQNALKHAGPSASVHICLSDNSTGASFSVIDNGRGFEPGGAHVGAGLLNIRERVTSAGGSVSVRSQPGAGTRVAGFVPDVLVGASPDDLRAAPKTGADSLRRQIVLETDAERRRIMRDLHDGAQQRLVALRVKVSLATELATDRDDKRATLERTARELDLAIAELRDLARGLLATSDRSVAPALREVTRHWAMDVRIRERSSLQRDREAHAAVFECVLEALQHARAQSSPAATSSAVVSVVQASDAIHFVVRGHGRAFELGQPAAHASAVHVVDRASAAGGSLSYRPLPDHGVLIRGMIPFATGAGTAVAGVAP